MNRRDFLLSTTGLLLTPSVMLGQESSEAAAETREIARLDEDDGAVLSGPATPGFERMDQRVAKWLRENAKPGGVLVIARKGRLIYARGFGYAGTSLKRPFLPTTVFRYGSVAKWFTATAFMRLVERGAINLDSPITVCPALVGILSHDVSADPRLPKLTFRRLLSHSSGLKYTKHFQSDWYRIKGGKLVSLEEWVRFGLSEGFKWEPGTQTEYTNFNYILAHYLLEKSSGESYDAFVQREVFKRAGVNGITLAGMRATERLQNESQYYVIGDPKIRSIWPEDEGKEVSTAYSTDLRTAAGAGGY